jgi:glycosyltransferase involved in cell wall biosynthesis
MEEVWVCTPTLPERTKLLRECQASVVAQTSPVTHHLVFVDRHREGPGTIRNRLAHEVPDGAWITFLDDDDLWKPHHVATLMPHLCSTDWDVVYTLADISGRPGWDPQQETFDPDRLRRANFIPLCGVAIRAEFFKLIGGFPTEGWLYEDWGMLLGLLDAEARFLCVPERTWTYRFGRWDSRQKEVLDGRRKG